MLNKNLATLLSLMALSASAVAQDVIQTYEEARNTYFWNGLYQGGGKTIYCGIPFTRENHGTLKLHVEHVYPASWIASHFGCKNREFCPVDVYHHAAADLHNLWPSAGKINMARNNLHFGTLTGESARINTDDCQDFERIGSKTHGIVEPRDEVKGDIARTMFYMELAYGLPLGRVRNTYLKWDKEDPVDAQELQRNKQIKRMQKRGNPFIGRMASNGLKRLKPLEW